MRWEGEKSRRLVKWEGGKDGKMVRREVERYLVLFKGGEHKMSPRLYLFVSDVIQGNKEVVWVQGFLAWPQGWKGST